MHKLLKTEIQAIRMYRHAGKLRSIVVDARHGKVMMKKTIGNRTGSDMPSLMSVSGA